MIQGAAFRTLACFHDADTRSFVELCEKAGYPTDLGGYYIRQLLSGGYIEKLERGSYGILPKGKQQLAFYYGKELFAPRPRLTVLIVAQQQGHFVVVRRKVQPFIGTAEWPAGVVTMGEPLPEAASRVLQLRLKVAAQPKLVGFFRRIDMYEDTVFDDKLFAVHTCELPAETQLSGDTGEILLATEKELRNLSRPAKSLLDILSFVDSQQAGSIEKVYHLVLSDLAE